MDLLKKRILVTGGAGFLGKHITAILDKAGVQRLELSDKYVDGYLIPRSSDFDLSTETDVSTLMRLVQPEVVIHLAAMVGGIGINQLKPGTFYYKNLIMGAMLLEYARQHCVEKFVCVGTICSYPKYTQVPFKEEDLWNGYPEETNAAYGIAKKALLVQSQAYRQEFDFNSIYLLPVNLYGPHDNFDYETSHVIPALIRKCIEARENKLPEILCWGTGSATRELLYVEDAARGIVLATEEYDKADPVNLGYGQEISIRDLVELIAHMTGYTGKIIWDATKPDGQPRRCLDVSKAEKEFNFKAKVSLKDGLMETINWYEHNR